MLTSFSEQQISTAVNTFVALATIDSISRIGEYLICADQPLKTADLCQKLIVLTTERLTLSTVRLNTYHF